MTVLETIDAARKLALQNMNAKQIARQIDCHYQTAIAAVRWTHTRSEIPAPRGAGAAGAASGDAAAAKINQARTT